jgi:uncharacterized protein (TIGR02145 family)
MKTKSFLSLAATLALAITFTFSCSSGDDPDNGNGSKGNDIANYKTKQIGDQVWMAENLNYAVSGSKCYGEGERVLVGYDQETDTDIFTTLSNAEVQTNCAKYGRLYDWATAMALPSNCNSSSCSEQIGTKHRGVCPQGWHIPSDDDWATLMNFVGGRSTAGTKLKATSGWNWNDDDGISGNGTDEFGFSALPGGIYEDSPHDNFYGVGSDGCWWSADEYDSGIAFLRCMFYYGEYVFYDAESKSGLLSVRCLQD